MTALNLLRNNLIKIGLWLSVFLIPFPIRYFNIGAGILILGFLISPDLGIRISNSVKKKGTWIFSSLFFLIAIGYFYTVETNLNYNQLELSISFVAIPLLINGLFEHEKKGILNTFVISSFCVSIICLLYALYRNFFDYDTVANTNWGAHDSVIFDEKYSNSLVNWNYFSYREFTSAINIHPIYLATYILFSATIIVNQLLRKSRLIKQIVPRVILLLFFVMNIVIIGAKSPIISLILLSIVFGIYIVTKKRSRYAISIVLVFLIIFGSLLYSVPGTSFRIKRSISSLFDSNSDYEKESSLVTSSTKHRLFIWKETIKLVGKRPIFGYGTEGDRFALNQVYDKFGYTTYYNTHNQYLKYLLCYGAVGLILFLILLVYPTYISLRNNDLQYFFFMLLICTIFLTENVLSVQKGVVFYSFFNSLLFGYRKRLTALK